MVHPPLFGGGRPRPTAGYGPPSRSASSMPAWRPVIVGACSRASSSARNAAGAADRRLISSSRAAATGGASRANPAAGNPRERASNPSMILARAHPSRNSCAATSSANAPDALMASADGVPHPAGNGQFASPPLLSTSTAPPTAAAAVPPPVSHPGPRSGRAHKSPAPNRRSFDTVRA